MTRRTLLALGALLSTLVIGSAAGAPEAADIRGSYFGNFTSSAGNSLQSDLNITLQDRKVIGGTFTMGAVLRSVIFVGKCRNDVFTATAVIREPDGKTRIKLTGGCDAGEPGGLASLTGTYRISGQHRETGTFLFTGASNL